MTIDEAIAHAREKAKEQRYYSNFEKNSLMYRSCVKCAEEHEQLAGWLEELKEYRKHIKLTEIQEQYKLGFQDGIVNGFEKGYNKALDDYKYSLIERIEVGRCIDEKFAYIDLCDIDEIVKQLKEGGKNES